MQFLENAAVLLAPLLGKLSSKARLRGFVFFYQNYNNEKVLHQQTFSSDFCAENALSPNKKGPPGGAFGKGVVIVT